MEDLIIKALPDVARLDTLPQAGSDMLILSVASSLSSSTENLPSNQLVTVNNTTIPPVTNTDLPIPSTSTQITVSLSSSAPPQSQSPSQAQSQLLPTAPPAPEDVPTLLDQLKPKLEMDANAPKPVSNHLHFTLFPHSPSPLPLPIAPSCYPLSHGDTMPILFHLL